MQQEKEDELFQKRMIELSKKAERTYAEYYTDFLNLNEIHLLHTVQKELYAPVELFGGTETAERKMLCFYHADLAESKHMFPIACIHLFPAHAKFGEELSHRDILGAVLHLGLDRAKIGDIHIQEKEAYLFCTEKIAPFLLENLTKIRHTSMRAELTEDFLHVYTPKVMRISGTVSSLRLDSVIALAFSASRSSLIAYITAGKVFVNGKQIVSNSYTLKEQDIISIRGLGRARFIEAGYETKKGRLHITVEKFI